MTTIIKDGSIKTYIDEKRFKRLVTDTGGSPFSNTTTETSILSGTVSIPAGTFTVGSRLRIVAQGHYLNNSGANSTLTFKIKIAGTSIVSWATANIGTNAFSGGFLVESDIVIVSNTSVRATLKALFTNPLNTNVSGLHVDFATATIANVVTTATVFDATITMGTATATQTITPEDVQIDFIPA